MLKQLLYGIVGQTARIHEYILQLNDTFEYNFSDKALHFLVIGILGIALVFLLYPLFRFLARRHHEFAITWIYVFTLIVVITFAIEIGQQITGTGSMEFADIMFGIIGFILIFAVFAVIRWVFRLFFPGREKHDPKSGR